MCMGNMQCPGVYVTGEGWAILFTASLGLSNGYFGSIPMIIAPTRVPDEQKELTGEHGLYTLCHQIYTLF
jgi:hypothetical protein